MLCAKVPLLLHLQSANARSRRDFFGAISLPLNAPGNTWILLGVQYSRSLTSADGCCLVKIHRPSAKTPFPSAASIALGMTGSATHFIPAVHYFWLNLSTQASKQSAHSIQRPGSLCACGLRSCVPTNLIDHSSERNGETANCCMLQSAVCSLRISSLVVSSPRCFCCSLQYLATRWPQPETMPFLRLFSPAGPIYLFRRSRPAMAGHGFGNIPIDGRHTLPDDGINGIVIIPLSFLISLSMCVRALQGQQTISQSGIYTHVVKHPGSDLDSGPAYLPPVDRSAQRASCNLRNLDVKFTPILDAVSHTSSPWSGGCRRRGRICLRIWIAGSHQNGL